VNKRDRERDKERETEQREKQISEHNNHLQAY